MTEGTALRTFIYKIEASSSRGAYPDMSPFGILLFPLISRRREDEGESRAMPGLTRDFNEAVVIAHNAPRDSQTQSAAARLRGIKRLKNPFNVFGGNTRP